MTVVADATTPPISTASKRQLVEQAFTEVSLNGWEYDISADEKDVALKRLDALMYELAGRGLSLSYNFPTAIGEGDLNDALGVPDGAFFGLAILLAERLCPTMGKTMSRESRIALQSAMKTVTAIGQTVPTMNWATGTVLGTGNKPWANRYPFVLPVTTG